MKPHIVLAATVLAAVSGCTATAGLNPLAISTMPVSAPRVTDISVPSPRDFPSTSTDRTRFLIVGVDRYESQELGLAAAGRSADYFQEQLELRGIDASDITLLTGDAPTAGAVRSAIKDLARSDRTASLVVLWIGHGVNHDGTRRLLTRETALAAGGIGYSETMGMHVLGQLMTAESARAEAEGRSLFTALFVDACAINSAGAPGVVEDFASGPDIEAISASDGRAAIVGSATGLLPFTEHLAEGIRESGSLLTAARRAVGETSDSGARIISAKQDVQVADTSPTVRIVDCGTGTPIVGAVVRRGDVVLSETAPGTYDLSGARGSETLSVEVPGYLGFRQRMTTRGIGEIEIPLMPELVILQLQASEDDLPYQLSFEGAEGEKWRVDYHKREEREVNAETHEVYVPRGTRARLVTRRGAKELTVVELLEVDADQTVEVGGHAIPWASVRIGSQGPGLKGGSVWKGKVAIRRPQSHRAKWKNFRIEVHEADATSFSGVIDDFGGIFKDISFHGVISEEGELQAVLDLPPGEHFHKFSFTKDRLRIKQIDLRGQIEGDRWKGTTHIHTASWIFGTVSGGFEVERFLQR